MRSDGIIPRDLRDKVDRELESGERIAWIDMPKPRFFTGPALGAFLFAIPWTAFAIFWMTVAGAGVWFSEGRFGASSIFPLFGLPFVLIGLGMLSTPIWAYRKARKTVYVITDRRAISFEGGRSMTVRTYRPDQLREIFRREKADGSGDVILARDEQTAWRNSNQIARWTERGFLRVRNVRDVERMLRELAEQAAPPAEGQARQKRAAR